MQVTRLTSSVGAQVDLLDLMAIGDAEVGQIRATLHEHGVLVFRDQKMSREDQLTFTSRLGPVHGHPVTEFLRGAGDPFGIVENDADKPPQDSQNFHVDYSFNREIPDLAVLRAEVIPPRGGDTIWSSAAAAYDAMSSRLKDMLEGLVALHEAGEKFWFEMRRTLGDDAASRARSQFDGNRHPIIGAHPYTGRMLLFVNPGYTTRIDELTTSESTGMLAMLFAHVNNPAFHYRHRWLPGDVVIWDEHQTTHMGPNDFYPAERRLTRLTVGRTTPCANAA